jgi:hypothetical protein
MAGYEPATDTGRLEGNWATNVAISARRKLQASHPVNAIQDTLRAARAVKDPLAEFGPSATDLAAHP